jgi:hypothetical protein
VEPSHSLSILSMGLFIFFADTTGTYFVKEEQSHAPESRSGSGGRVQQFLLFNTQKQPKSDLDLDFSYYIVNIFCQDEKDLQRMKIRS